MTDYNYREVPLSHTIPFLASWVVFLMLGIIIYSGFEHGSFFLWINDHHSAFFDAYFVFFSRIGDGEYFGYLLILLGLWKLKYLITGATGFLAGGAVVHILKRVFDLPRPTAYYYGVELNLVEGVKTYTQHSFPSGHSASGFAIFLFLSIICKSRILSFIFFFLALMVGFSRIYLAQHFFADVYVGAIIGVVFMLWIYVVWERSDKIRNAKWYNYSAAKTLLKSLKTSS